mmetsp:Transcript_38243/g.89792  ORF Transcript_38243/g.89792 Transcript_38243/m.89792 type:complete len:85 (-) Transcript_38243:175-429(-)
MKGSSILFRDATQALGDHLGLGPSLERGFLRVGLLGVVVEKMLSISSALFRVMDLAKDGGWEVVAPFEALLAALFFIYQLVAFP